MPDETGVLAFTDRLHRDELVAVALRLEELGYGAIWLPDLFGREIFVTASFLLAQTSRIRVATGIAHVYARDAISTAQAARTLAELYDGRFILGLGVSHPQAAEARGHTWIPPVRKLRSYLRDIAAASVRSPEPARIAPIYIAAHGPKLLELAATSADGANTYLMPPEHTRRAREILGSDKALNVVLPCCLCPDEERARQVGRKGLAMYLGLPAYQRQWARFGLADADLEGGGSDRLVDSLVAWGNEAAIRERIAAHRDAGASQIEILPLNPDPKPVGPHWELLETLAPGRRQP
jgi:probable F420-dependent oxidoreductase